MYSYVFICIYIYLDAFIWWHLHSHGFICIYCVHVYSCVYMHSPVFRCVHMHSNVLLCIFVYSYVYMDTHVCCIFRYSSVCLGILYRGKKGLVIANGVRIFVMFRAASLASLSKQCIWFFLSLGESWFRGFSGPRWHFCVQEPRAECRQSLHGVRLLQDVHSESQRRTAQLFRNYCRDPARQLPKEAFQQEPRGPKLGTNLEQVSFSLA